MASRRGRSKHVRGVRWPRAVGRGRGTGSSPRGTPRRKQDRLLPAATAEPRGDAHGSSSRALVHGPSHGRELRSVPQFPEGKGKPPRLLDPGGEFDRPERTVPPSRLKLAPARSEVTGSAPRPESPANRRSVAVSGPSPAPRRPHRARFPRRRRRLHAAGRVWRARTAHPASRRRATSGRGAALGKPACARGTRRIVRPVHVPRRPWRGPRRSRRPRAARPPPPGRWPRSRTEAPPLWDATAATPAFRELGALERIRYGPDEGRPDQRNSAPAQRGTQGRDDLRERHRTVCVGRRKILTAAFEDIQECRLGPEVHAERHEVQGVAHPVLVGGVSP